MRSKQAMDALKFGMDPCSSAKGVATSATMERAVNASETENPSDPDLVQNTDAVMTTAGVIWSEKLAKSRQFMMYICARIILVTYHDNANDESPELFR